MSTYAIKARIKKCFFAQDHIVYDIIEHYQEWYDPSYGNGGGDYRSNTRVLGTYTCGPAAELALNALNKYKGETHNV